MFLCQLLVLQESMVYIIVPTGISNFTLLFSASLNLLLAVPNIRIYIYFAACDLMLIICIKNYFSVT